MKNFKVKVVKIGSGRPARFILILASDEKEAVKRAEEKLGARWGVIPGAEECSE